MADDPSMEQLRAWKQAVELEITVLAQKLEPLQTQMKSARERLDLIVRLLHLSDGTERSSRGDLRNHTSVGLEAKVEGLLRQVGHPLHIREIRERLVTAGVPLPGKGTEANIIVRIGRAKGRFSRTGRGLYGLSEWGEPELHGNVARKRRGRKKRLRKRSTPRISGEARGGTP